MIVAFLAFGLALVQVLLYEGLISSRKKVIIAMLVIIISGIPIFGQLVVLLAELSRARRYSTRVLLHRMIMNIFGSYGPTANLIVKQYRHKKFGDYKDANGWLWYCVLYLSHGLAKFFGALPFGDAFSGKFNVRHSSVVLWLGDGCGSWEGCIKPLIQDDDNELFSKPVVKDVRDLTLTVEFSPTGKLQSREIPYEVLATGSKDSLISKLYFESWKGKCSKEGALEFCRLMETLDDDSFIVKSCPPEQNDQILYCEELDVIVRSILTENKNLNARRVYGMSYV